MRYDKGPSPRKAALEANRLSNFCFLVCFHGSFESYGTAPTNVGAMRAFFDFILQAGRAHRP